MNEFFVNKVQGFIYNILQEESIRKGKKSYEEQKLLILLKSVDTDEI